MDALQVVGECRTANSEKHYQNGDYIFHFNYLSGNKKFQLMPENLAPYSGRRAGCGRTWHYVRRNSKLKFHRFRGDRRGGRGIFNRFACRAAKPAGNGPAPSTGAVGNFKNGETSAAIKGASL
jgi:hypothetical protein